MVVVQKRKIRWAIYLLLVMLYFSGLTAQAQYGGGTGEPNDPYLIYTAEQMNAIGADANDWDKHFKLMADIDLAAYTGKDFNIIGHGSYGSFRGVFDGSGKTISNFSYICTDRNYIGLFGYIRGATIKDLGLIDPNVDAGTGGNVGSLVGYLRYGTITNCYAKGGSVTGDYHVGGLVGRTVGTITDCNFTGSASGTMDVGGLVGDNGGEGTIGNCYATGSVSGQNNVGGLAGQNDDGRITNSSSSAHVEGLDRVGGLVGRNNGSISSCYSTGDVNGVEEVGGLVGDNDGDDDEEGTIGNCYATGSVSGTTDVGGLVGALNYGAISNCYSSGSVSGDDNVGGLVGGNYGRISNCYSVGGVRGTVDVGGLVGSGAAWRVANSFWDTQTSGQTVSAGGTGKTTAEMQTESTFTDAGWDFVGESVNGTEDIWSICEGTNYPKLAWQFVIGDFDGDDDTDFADFAIFAARWLQTDSSFWCGGGGTDLTNDGEVDFNDLKEFAENWLAGVRSD